MTRSNSINGIMAGPMRNQKFAILLLTIVFAFYAVVLRDTNPQTFEGRKVQAQYGGRGWVNERTVSKTVLADTKFARCENHVVRSEDGKSVVSDWLWMEEHDAVNVIVVNRSGKFLVMKQKKYGIHDFTFSPVGGLIDAGESPFEAARREVIEELGVGSAKTLEMTRNGVSITSQPPMNDLGEADGNIPEEERADWIFLGSYRSAVNRGGGFVYLYLLKNSVAVKEGGGTRNYHGSGDDEAQKIFHFDMEQIRTSLEKFEFKEVKWTAALAMSLLHLQLDMFAGKPDGQVLKPLVSGSE